MLPPPAFDAVEWPSSYPFVHCPTKYRVRELRRADAEEAACQSVGISKSIWSADAGCDRRWLRQLDRLWDRAESVDAQLWVVEAIGNLPPRHPFSEASYERLVRIVNDEDTPRDTTVRDLATIHAAGRLAHVSAAFQFVVLSDARARDGVVELATAEAMSRALPLPDWDTRAAPYATPAVTWWIDPDALVLPRAWGISYNGYTRYSTVDRWLSQARRHAEAPWAPARFEVLLMKIRSTGLFALRPTLSRPVLNWLSALEAFPPPIVADQPDAHQDLQQVIEATRAVLLGGGPPRIVPELLERNQPRVTAHEAFWASVDFVCEEDSP